VSANGRGVVLEAQGVADAQRDTALMSSHPGCPPIGPDPSLDWSFMYGRGYESAFQPGFHAPCSQCRKEKEEEDEDDDVQPRPVSV